MTEWDGRRLHFIAIGGAGMSGLALVARQLGAEVTGSDRAESSYMERLRAAGLQPQLGHDAANLPEGVDVVVSTAVPEDNPELELARRRGQRVLHRGELLAELCGRRRLLAVAGTHGKTTTTAMAVHALREAGADPSFFLGGELPGAGPGGEATNAGWGDGEWVVAEADESDASFLQLRPEVAVITNLELDHHSRWASLSELQGAFGEFAAPAEHLVEGEAVEIAHRDGARWVRFAIADGDRGMGGAWMTEQGWVTAHGLESSPEGTRFSVHGLAAEEVAVSLPLHGRHNVLNALAALAALTIPDTGLDPARAASTLERFPGVARRLERKGMRNGAVIYDDYAHHPTEVAAALQAARELQPGRLIAAFQPHLYSRTKAMANEFGAALAAADEVVVLDVYPAREEPVGPLAGVSGRMVAAATADRAAGRPVWWLPDAGTAARALGPRLEQGDLVITIGAGDIFKLAEALSGPASTAAGPSEGDLDERP